MVNVVVKVRAGVEEGSHFSGVAKLYLIALALPACHFCTSVHGRQDAKFVLGHQLQTQDGGSIVEGAKFVSEFMQKLVISNYTGRYTTIHRRKWPSDKGKPPKINLAVLSKDAFCLFAAATHTSILRNKYGNPNPD